MAIRDKVFTTYLRNSMFPPDWVRASICAPKELLDRFLKEVERERIKHFSQNG